MVIWKRKCVKKLQGFEDIDFPNHIMQFDKALDDLKQAPRAGYERISNFLLENSIKKGIIDNTLFLKSRGKNLLVVQVYVDDIIFGEPSETLCEDFTKLTGSEFEMIMMEELNFFLGL